MVGTQILADLWDRHLKREYDDVHVLYLHVHPAGHVHTHSRPIRRLEDFRGMKLRAPTAVVGDTGGRPSWSQGTARDLDAPCRSSCSHC